jgi:hypothetical protein
MMGDQSLEKQSRQAAGIEWPVRAGFVMVVGVVGACAPSEPPVEPTPYQAYDSLSAAGHPPGGYYSVELGPGVYLVTFRGTVATSEETVSAFANRRAAELCGGDHRFKVLDDRDLSHVEERAEANGENIGGSAWADVHGDAQPSKPAGPQRRLVVRCEDDR